MGKIMQKFTLKTGKTISANAGIFGLTPDFSITEGYDGTIAKYEEQKIWDEDILPTDTYVITIAEQIEIADIMIARWTEFKQKCAASHD